MNWKLSSRLDSESYAPLQAGILTNLRLKNLYNKKMIVTHVLLRFDWQGSYRFFTECNIKIGPHKAADLPDIKFNIALSASKGSHNYKPGISYLLLEDDEWKPYREEYDPKGEFLEIQPLPKKDFTVFISHSNAQEDKKIIRECKSAMNSCGITGYFAEDDFKPGTVIWNKIKTKIAYSDAFMVLWTENASKSGDVREEIGIAIGNDKQKQIVPIVEEGIEVTGSIKSLGIEWITYTPPNFQRTLSDALGIIMNWATIKEREKFRSTMPKNNLSTSGQRVSRSYSGHRVTRK
jgi:hypothetical protein